MTRLQLETIEDALDVAEAIQVASIMRAQKSKALRENEREMYARAHELAQLAVRVYLTKLEEKR